MNKKTVVILKRYARESGFNWKKYHKEYLALSWTKRREYKLKLLDQLNDRNKMYYKFERGLGKKDIRIAKS